MEISLKSFRGEKGAEDKDGCCVVRKVSLVGTKEIQIKMPSSEAGRYCKGDRE